MKPTLQLYGHSKGLTTPTEAVNLGTGLPRARNIINQLCIALGHLNGLGLAANQMGFKESIFVWKMPRKPYRHLINPKITDLSDEMWEYEEGCLSIPGKFWKIERPRVVVVSGFDSDGNERVIEARDLEGRLFQHECDHMAGELLLKKLTPEQLQEGIYVQ